MGRSEAENNTPKLGEDFFTTEAPTTELLGRLAEVSEQVRTRFTEGCETNGENFVKGFIVSDIDGTIYSKSKLPTERTATAFKRCRDLGYTVILATGGPKAQALKVLPSLNFEVDYLVCSNGNEAWKVDGSTQKLNRIFVTHMQEKVADRIRAVIDDTLGHESVHRHFSLFDLSEDEKESGFSADTQQDMDALMEQSSLPEKVTSWMRTTGIHATPAHRARCRPILCMILSMTNKTQTEILVKVRQILADASIKDLKVFGLLTSVGIGCNSKASGVRFLIKSLNPESIPEDVIAFGDGANDIEMLAWAGKGVVMKNATSTVKECPFIHHMTESVDNDGVARVLEKVIAENKAIRVVKI
mmetsp:Transcript_7349/g.9607  ORF Transcript_7349/g.9607 Transcript_7349/m.9607 type:complete len:358 (+) Transcript_7349:43-1116(+)